jgi:hypothetical protein
VSWGAIAAGAAAAATLSLIMLILGVGLGLSTVSPWAHDGQSATTFGVSTILWVTLTQLVSSAMGGYLAGRLRTKWSGIHTDEVYFRDTADVQYEIVKCGRVIRQREMWAHWRITSAFAVPT